MTQLNKTERNVRRFLLAAMAGGACWLFLLTCTILSDSLWSLPFPVPIIGFAEFVTTILCVVVLGVYRKSDECTHSLWYYGVSMGFATGVAIGLFGARIEYAYLRLVISIDELPGRGDLVSDHYGEAMILAFFLTIIIEHFRRSRASD